jgi:two-component system cell cycle response regulator DivK
MPKILLVEDNEDNRDMLIRRLSRRGFEIIVAVDGAQGIDKAHSEMPDLILMDMDLPVIDGWTATSRIKTSPQTQAIPVIGLSANAMSGDRDRGMAAGCNDYDIKPIEIGRLVEKIETQLNRNAR